MTSEAHRKPIPRWPWYAALATLSVTVGLVALGIVLSTKHDETAAPLSLDPSSGWREIAWELPATPWWQSKAFRCAATRCGADMKLYLRIKVGFCNCTDGVADDAELERIGDYIVISRRQDAQSDGRSISAAGLKGRSRPYRLVLNGPEQRSADSVLIGLNSGCDAVVATSIAEGSGRMETAVAERATTAFIESAAVRQWVMRALGK